MKIIKAVACLVVLSGATAAAAILAPRADEQATTARRAQTGKLLTAGGGRLGVSVREVEDEDVKSGRLAGAAGAVVEEVSEGSAAEKAGIRKGDILVEFDGERVRGVRQLTRLVQETADGRKVAVVVVRDGQRVTLSVEPRQGRGTAFDLRGLEDWGRDFRFELPARPVPPAPAAPRVRPSPPSTWRFDDFFARGNGRLGITVDGLSPQLAEYFGSKQGVLVTSVQDNSPAAKAGLKAGDIVTSVNGTAIDDPAELRRRLQSIDEGEGFTIGIVRDKKPQTLKGTLDQAVRRRSYRSLI